MSDDELPVYIIPEFSSSLSSSSSVGFEFLASVALAALGEDTAPSSAHTRRYIWRDRHSAHERLMNIYHCIISLVSLFGECFGIRGFLAIQKCTCALRQLAYDNLADNYDEGLTFSTRTVRECLNNFCIAIKYLYGEEYLRSPTNHDVALLYEAREAQHHFPGMISSINCTHWTWRNCPHSLRGQYHWVDHERPTIVLEAVASYDLWFWHAYFGVSRSNNDINVLKQSPLFIPEVNKKSPEHGFTVNRLRYNRGYYLGGGIYPPWSCFVKEYAYPVARKKKIMKKLQDSARKYVERAFGLLKNKWAIIDR
uniref:uncharacterized protein LOC122592254 n=1 Tax=Erigeron canadensis TaxID=72917 RepID=UPI001CB8C6B4|nr:uncharacterized protein LOC122592254 [Erigeron canadensis]